MGVLLSFVFGSILQYIFVFIITALTILLFIKFKKRSELIKDNLIKLIKDNNFKE
jgi:ABC-type Mn2+/Zn2+ transport system permease subunit